MRQLVRDQRRDLGPADPATVARFWCAVVWDVVRTAPREHRDALRQKAAGGRRARRLLGAALLLASVANVAYDLAAPEESMGALALLLTALAAISGGALVARARRVSSPDLPEACMPIAALNVIVALLLGFGAAQELAVRGIRDGQTQPSVIGAAGVLVAVLLALSGLALWRRWPVARRLTIVAAVLCIAFHAYAALPPHRNLGILALLVGVGYGLILLARTGSHAANG